MGSLENKFTMYNVYKTPNFFDVCASMISPTLFAIDSCGRERLRTKANNRFAKAGAKHSKFLQAKSNEQSCLACLPRNCNARENM